MPHSPLPTTRPSTPQNHLLRSLPAPDLAALMAALEPVELPILHVLHEPDEPIAHVYFVEEGVVSQVAQLEGGQEIEVGLIGPEGLVGFATALGVDCTSTEAMVQAPGRALRLPVAVLRQEVARGGALSRGVFAFTYAMMAQASQVAACNARHALPERLARWLLMMHDRLGENRMPITHEFISIMLGVRRSGVTIAVGSLERAGVIVRERGAITIQSRARLERASCECYDTIRRESERTQG